MKRLLAILVALGALAVLLLAIGGSAVGGDEKGKALERAATGELKPATLTVEVTKNGKTQTVTKTLPFISDGTIAAAQAALGVHAAEERAEAADAASGVDIGASVDLGAAAATVGCSDRTEQNVRVNQDCSFRRQAEEDIVHNPANPDNLIAGQNDSRAGFNQCGIDFSTDNGRHWGDMIPPFRQKVNNPAAEVGPVTGDPNSHTLFGGAGTFHTYDAGSDPTVAFDSKGRGYFSCLGFDVFTDANMLYVTASPVGANGAFFFNISSFSRRFIVVEDNNPKAFHDKQFITADTFPGSPNKDNVYATWTVFDFTCGAGGNSYCSSPIFGSMSTNGGQTWSTPKKISGSSAALCIFGNFFDPSQGANDCNFDQGSDPIALPNGDLVVVFNNGNTPGNNNQQLAVHCHPTGSSTAGTANLNCGAPVKVGDDIVDIGSDGTLDAPLCNFGGGDIRFCIPGHFIRTNDFARIAVNTDNGHIFAAWQDYRNGEFDIQLTRSVDGGLTWAPSVTVNPDTGLDHYFAAIDIAETGGGDRVGVSYNRTERVPGETGGFFPASSPVVRLGLADLVLAAGEGLQVPFRFEVVSPPFRAPDGIQAGFNGDYTGLTINRGEEAHPIWSDTRNGDPFAPANGVTRDEDIFTDKVNLPNGIAKPSVGQIGKK